MLVPKQIDRFREINNNVIFFCQIYDNRSSFIDKIVYLNTTYVSCILKYARGLYIIPLSKTCRSPQKILNLNNVLFYSRYTFHSSSWYP